MVIIWKVMKAVTVMKLTSLKHLKCMSTKSIFYLKTGHVFIMLLTVQLITCFDIIQFLCTKLILNKHGCNIASFYCVFQYCLTLTKGSKSQITHIWESYDFRLDFIAYSTSILSLEQKHSSCWKIFTSRHHDIALMSMYMTDTLCSFTRNVIFKSCFLLSEYGRIVICVNAILEEELITILSWRFAVIWQGWHHWLLYWLGCWWNLLLKEW